MRRVKKWIPVLFMVFVSIIASGDTVEISMENDTIAGTDKHYTHGTRITYSYPFEDNLYPKKDLLRSWIIGQYMYTPSDITIDTVQVGDRPYAGWLYAGTSVSCQDDKTFDMWEIDLGVSGKYSGAGATQKKIHQWIDSKEPKGWDTELDERLGIDFSVIKKFKWEYEYVNFVLGGNVTAGSMHVNSGVGGTLRFGYNVPSDFGAVRMEPTPRAITDLSAYGILKSSAWVVGYNYFIEGDNTERIYKINAERCVYDYSVGGAVCYKSFGLMYLYNIRSKEFKEQDGFNKFGTIAISWNY